MRIVAALANRDHRTMSVSPFELVARDATRPLLVIGAGLDGSGTSRGETRAPDRLRELGLAARIGATDFGNLGVAIDDPTIDPDAGIRGYHALVSASRTVADAIASALSAGWRPVVVGGCCSVVPGALAGVRRHLGPFALAFVDGHLDLFDGQSSSTGEVAGMDLAIVVGHGPSELIRLGGEPPLVDQRDVIAVGDGDRQRRVALRAPGPAEIAPELRVIEAGEVIRRGPLEVGGELADNIGGGSAPFWVHFDVDVVDASAMPAVTFPVATGLSWAQVTQLLSPVLASPRLIGLSVTDYNPDLDQDGTLGERIIETLVYGLAGQS
jgi:arginase